MPANLHELRKDELIARIEQLQTQLENDQERLRLAEELNVHREELQTQSTQLEEALRQLEQSRDEYAQLYDLAPVAYLTLDRYGVIQNINLTGCAFLGLERARIQGTNLTRYFSKADRQKLNEHFVACLRSSLSNFAEAALISGAGQEVPVQLTSKRFGADEEYVLIRTAITDLSLRKRAEAQIRESNTELERRVAERTVELEQATQALREADRRKNEFLAMLGHELRNPLGPIRNALEVWRMSEPNPQDASTGLMREILDRQVNHMSRIIDDLLDVSRISQGKIILHPNVLDLVGLLRSTLEDLRGECEAAGVQLSLELPEHPLWVRGDATRLAQAITNLLNNARKFTDAGGHIFVRLRRQGDEACISVRDTGIGMEPDILRQLFQPFSQADRSLDRSRGGLGLGLSLVRGLIQMHGGDVTAVSAGLGKGSEFTLSLPLTEPAEMKAATPSEASPAANAQPLRILVIDDGRDTVITMRTLLRKLGHDVAIAHDGEEGLEVARQFQPQVIFSDIGLPGIDGYAVARRLRKDCQFAGDLIAVTGYGQLDDQQQALQAGFDSHLTKPVAFADLQRLLSGQRGHTG